MLPPPDLADRIAVLLPAVVAVQAIAATPHGRVHSGGSGFIIEPSGIVVTNRHVIAGSYRITVTVPGLAPLNAIPLYISEEVDLALLKVQVGRQLPTVKLGDSDKIRIGDGVMLLGSPLGVGESLSVGVVSALNRDIGETPYDHFIQTDAALNHGSSGGPMFNMKGEVVGIDTALTSSPGNTGSVGIGYAMPINDAKFVIDQFMSKGRVIAGTLGLHVQRMTADLAAAFGMDHPRGAIVTVVAANGPGVGKIREGDIILTVGTQDAADPRAIARLIESTPPGQPLDIRLLRAGAERSVTLTVAMAESNPKQATGLLGRPPAQAKLFATPSDPGMGLSTIDDQLRAKYTLPPGLQGVVVTSVEPGGVAAERKIAVGDVILSVNGTPVGTPIDLRKRLGEVNLHEASDRDAPFAALLVTGENGNRWVVLPLEADR